MMRRVAEARLPTAYGEFRAIGFEDASDSTHPIALVMGEVAGREGVLVRLHSECLTGDVFGSLRCDCGAQLQLAMRCIAEEGRGVLLYFRGHEGRGIGLLHKLAAYALQEEGRDTVDANLDLGLPPDARGYDIGARILEELGITSVRLLTNNPAKLEGLAGSGVRIVERVPLETPPTPHNRDYLATKVARLGHLMDLGGGGEDGPAP
jgi:3,4-dihydroxy 2-butanone 4-phosphate synthase/GTP cyclohydrolase II